MDYKTLIDEETWRFIEETERHYPADAVTSSVEDQRAVYDALCRAFFQFYPDGVETEDRRIGHVPIRIYSSAPSQTQEKAILYMHGGGFVVGGLESHDDICAEICARTGFQVVSIDYRLAPEHKHPAMIEDCLLVIRDWLKTTDNAILLCGDSAGGNLAAAAAHILRGETDRIKGQVLIYPGLGGDVNTGSYLTHAEAPMLTRDDVLFYKDIRIDGPEPSADPAYAPLQDNDFSGLPPTVIFTAECDPLADDGAVYQAALSKAGGKAHLVQEKGLVHGYLRARCSVTRAEESFNRIVSALNALGAGIWPYDEADETLV